MRGEVIASGLDSSRPRSRGNAAPSRESTPRIGHVVRRYRWGDLRMKDWVLATYSGAKEETCPKSGLGFQNEAIKGETQAA